MFRNAAAWCAIAVMAFVSGCSSGSAPSEGQEHVSSAAARFLARYVTPDGRVIRRDQGGDIVSEGQAYGMLIAEIDGRPSTVRTIWRWTSAHLGRPDGLLRFHASGDGQIEDNQSASDADVLAAYALLRYRGTDEAALHAAGRRTARAVLDVEAVTVAGSPVLVAGPWARSASPPIVNPSYWMPSVFTAIAHYTGDARWRSAADTAVRLLSAVTNGGRTLPPDWAQLVNGRLGPITDPGGGAPVQYGLDAARLPLWFATACSADARRLAARWWANGLSTGNRAADLALALSGTPINTDTNPLPLLAGAAAARAAGDDKAERALQAQALRQAREVPTYYGDAWLALGGALLDGSLDPCSESGQG